MLPNEACTVMLLQLGLLESHRGHPVPGATIEIHMLAWAQY
jgi:hypothetical protein